MIKNQVDVVVLQHPQEQEHILATAPILAENLQRTIIKVGLSWKNLSHAIGREEDPKRWGVLYFGTGVSELLKKAEGKGLYLYQKSDKSLVPYFRSNAQQLRGMIVLDGTWSQAKALWWRNPWLLKLQRLILLPEAKSLYGRVRREPKKECLSTIESVGEALSILQKNSKIREGLNQALLEKISGASGSTRT